MKPLLHVDLDDRLDRAEVRAQLTKAIDAASGPELAEWARAYGEALILKAEDASDQSRLEEAEEAATDAEANLAKLSDLVESAAKGLQKIIEADDFSDDHYGPIDQIIGELEGAI